MGQIKIFSQRTMPKGDYAAFNEDTLAQLNAADKQALNIETQVNDYAATFNHFKVALDTPDASPLSPEAAKLENERDCAYSGYKAYLKVQANDENPTVSAAAARLLLALRGVEVEMGNPIHLNITRETAALNSLLRVMEPLAAENATVGATERLARVRRANDALVAIVGQRLAERAAKVSLKEIRPQLTGAYNAVVTRLNAQAVLQSSPALEKLIAEHNELIAQYLMRLAQHKGKAKPAAAGEENAVKN